MKRLLFVLTAVALLTPMAHAVPTLQLYLEGATYDATTETWVLDGSSGPATLWAIGNVNGPGGAGPILDVRLSAAYASAAGVSISLTPTTTGGLGGFFDPSTPGAPSFLQTVTDGSSPVLFGGGSLPSHGIYGAGTDWQEFMLGDFTLEDSPMADFIDAFPVAPLTGTGQINVYEVSVSGTDRVHFDLYNHVEGETHASFAPFSHDSETTPPIPEPGTLAMLGLGLSGVAYKLRRKKA